MKFYDRSEKTPSIARPQIQTRAGSSTFPRYQTGTDVELVETAPGKTGKSIAHVKFARQLCYIFYHSQECDRVMPAVKASSS
ncbi:MAG: hypothetical protein ACRC62_39025 [Microcoleus sp.]